MRPHHEPPATPACHDAEPLLFDDPTHPTIALSICAGCPVRDWCLRTVDPAASFYDGIAGGHVWRNGQVRDDDTHDPTLVYYLNGRDDETTVDPHAVRGFIDGVHDWTELTSVERIHAARHLYADSLLTSAQVADYCHLSWSTFKRYVIDGEPDPQPRGIYDRAAHGITRESRTP